MLRITVHDTPGALTFQLEGRLAGPWVRVLQECWQSELARQREPSLRVDLTEVTSIDAAGKACLAALHRQGAEFIAADCLTKAIVAEIIGSPAGSADEALKEQLEDKFVEDPVAGIRFPRYLASSTLERDGRTYYFVDEESRREFEKQPAAK